MHVGTDSSGSEPLVETSEEQMAGGLSISQQLVDSWHQELRAIEADIAALVSRKNSLQRKVDAYQALAEELMGEVEETENDESAKTLVEALGKAATSRPMSPAELKDKIMQTGYTGKFSSSYFYTAVQRAAERGVIVRTADRRYVAGHVSQ